MKRLLLILVPLVLLGTAITLRVNAKKAEVAAQNLQRENRKKAPPLVTVIAASRQDIEGDFESVGSVEAPYNVRIAPEVTGSVVYLQAREGDRVTVGQELVRLDPAQVEGQLRQATATLEEARSRLQQATINRDPAEAAVVTQVKNQEAALESALADVNQSEKNYNLLVAASAANVQDAANRVKTAEAEIASAEASVQSAQANLANATSKYNRIFDLYKQGYIAAQEVDDAKTNVAVMKSSVDVAKGQLNSAISKRDSAKSQLEAATQTSTINKTKYIAEMDYAKSRLKQARAALDYAKVNTAQKPAYQQNLQALKAAVRAAEANLRTVTARKADTVLRSPIDGVVTGRYMDPGAVATPGQAILTVQSTRQMWVNVPVPEEVTRKVAIGQQAKVTFDALPGSVFAAKVIQINPSADPLSRQFAMRATLENLQGQVKPGMFAHLSIVTERFDQVVAVPREAVTQAENVATVTVVDEKLVATKREVKLGASNATHISILSGLKPGEKVVTMSAFPIKDGQTVKFGDGKQAGNAPPDGAKPK